MVKTVGPFFVLQVVCVRTSCVARGVAIQPDEQDAYPEKKPGDRPVLFFLKRLAYLSERIQKTSWRASLSVIATAFGGIAMPETLFFQWLE